MKLRFQEDGSEEKGLFFSFALRNDANCPIRRSIIDPDFHQIKPFRYLANGQTQEGHLKSACRIQYQGRLELTARYRVVRLATKPIWVGSHRS